MAMWREAQALAADIAELIAELPRRRDADAIANQLMRAAGSVPAKIAEGFGRFSPGAYRNHLSIARGSLFELQSWLDLLCRRGLLVEEKLKALHDRASHTGKTITLRMKSLSGQNRYAREDDSAV